MLALKCNSNEMWQSHNELKSNYTKKKKNKTRRRRKNEENKNLLKQFVWVCVVRLKLEMDFRELVFVKTTLCPI